MFPFFKSNFVESCQRKAKRKYFKVRSVDKITLIGGVPSKRVFYTLSSKILVYKAFINQSIKKVLSRIFWYFDFGMCFGYEIKPHSRQI